MRSLVRRIERVEQLAKSEKLFLADCICFPNDEPPFFCCPEEEEIAASVKRALDGDRFVPYRVWIYVASWRRENEFRHRWYTLSRQYHKAWEVSFSGLPVELWPAEHKRVNGEFKLCLKDGTGLESLLPAAELTGKSRCGST